MNYVCLSDALTHDNIKKNMTEFQILTDNSNSVNLLNNLILAKKLYFCSNLKVRDHVLDQDGDVSQRTTVKLNWFRENFSADVFKHETET
jgi:hypothetical protein